MNLPEYLNKNVTIPKDGAIFISQSPGFRVSDFIRVFNNELDDTPYYWVFCLDGGEVIGGGTAAEDNANVSTRRFSFADAREWGAEWELSKEFPATPSPPKKVKSRERLFKGFNV